MIVRILFIKVIKYIDVTALEDSIGGDSLFGESELSGFGECACDAVVVSQGDWVVSFGHFESLLDLSASTVIENVV